MQNLQIYLSVLLNAQERKRWVDQWTGRTRKEKNHIKYWLFVYYVHVLLKNVNFFIFKKKKLPAERDRIIIETKKKALL